jgi:hypothetical protein
MDVVFNTVYLVLCSTSFSEQVRCICMCVKEFDLAVAWRERGGGGLGGRGCLDFGGMCCW